MNGVTVKIVLCALMIGIAALSLRSRFNLALVLLVMGMVVGFLILDRKI